MKAILLASESCRYPTPNFNNIAAIGRIVATNTE